MTSFWNSDRFKSELFTDAYVSEITDRDLLRLRNPPEKQVTPEHWNDGKVEPGSTRQTQSGTEYKHEGSGLGILLKLWDGQTFCVRFKNIFGLG